MAQRKLRLKLAEACPKKLRKNTNKYNLSDLNSINLHSRSRERGFKALETLSNQTDSVPRPVERFLHIKLTTL